MRQTDRELVHGIVRLHCFFNVRETILAVRRKCHDVLHLKTGGTGAVEYASGFEPEDYTNSEQTARLARQHGIDHDTSLDSS